MSAFNSDEKSRLPTRSPAGSQKTVVDHDAIFTQNAEALPTSKPKDNSLYEKAGDGSAASTSEDDGNDTELERRQSIVQELAREYTRHSAVNIDGDSMALFGSEDPNSPLNPNGKNFSARKWAKTLANVTNEHGSGYRTAGFVYQDLNVFGFGQETDYQKDVGNVWLEIPGLVRNLTSKTGGQRRIDILRDFNGIVEAGEMLVVLGPPGSGCSTFLKTIAGEMNGIYTDERAYFNYQGLSAKELHKHHAGDAIYTAEVDVHYPQLSVGDTLTFASRARCPRTLPPGVTANQYCDHLRDVVMAMYGISHTVNTRVGDNYVRGVSGGERKRVTIAEATLSNAPLQCWDNSTRGLDSANAVEFCKTLRLQSELFGQTCAVSIYQAPQSAYDLFDKVAVLYEGRQIFFGCTTEARQYFINLGFECPARQTTPDFLTSMTAPTERVIRPGWESRVPRTPDEFAACWKESRECAALKQQIEQYKTDHPLDGPDAEVFRNQKQSVQAKNQRLKSPFILSYGQQVKLCLWRGFKLLKGDPSLTLFSLIANSCTALIMSSLFYNLPENTSSFYSRSAVLFVAILANAFSSALEILTQYAQRPIVEKQRRYAFYHSSAEAFSSVLVDMPYKITNTICYDLIIYFMTNLNREPGNFFFFLLTTFLMVLSMSGLFRSIASLSRTLSQAMVPASILILALVIFTGFVIPVDYMLGWCRWINYLDPIAYY
ncbi:multidrug resistance protein CDR1 [Colletotrichum lupini]|nr:multidrug resistance protein CDR1 [Colletotrichum lupini]